MLYLEAVEFFTSNINHTSIDFFFPVSFGLITMSNRVQLYGNMLEIKNTTEFVCVFQLRRLQSNAVSCLAKEKKNRGREWKTPSSVCVLHFRYTHMPPRCCVSDAIVKKAQIVFFASFFSPHRYCPHFDESFTQFLIIHHVDQRKPLYI